MSNRDKALFLFFSSWIGIGILVVIGALLLPAFLSERTRLIRLRETYADQRGLEARMKRYLETLSDKSATMTAEIAARRGTMASSTFQRQNETAIPSFIDSLQDLFGLSGVGLVNLGYKARVIEDGFVDLPFVAQVKCTYAGMRRLLHALEAHHAGIRIVNLEFLSLDDAEHLAQLRVHCQARFEAHE